MNETKAQNIVVLMTLITIGSTSSAFLVKPTPQSQRLKIHRTIIGGFFAMFGCAILVEIDTRLGAYLAILIGGGAFAKYGIPTILQIQKEHK